MRSLSPYVLSALLFLFALPVHTYSQGFGSGGAGAGVGAARYNPPGPSSSSNLNGYGAIQITGTSKIAVAPQALRLVVAVTSEAESANACGQSVKATIGNIRRTLNEIGITDENIVEDFIEVKPQFKWEPETRKKLSFLVESEDGFRMQSNLHILCKDEEQALSAIDKSFVAGISEVISFDYWHEDLDQLKQEALQQALTAANQKATVLLSIFDEKPRVMNVNNSISVNRPVSQYKTILPNKDNPNHPSYRYPNWNGYFKIYAQHPSTTFYAGDNGYADTSPKLPPMNPMITVTSTVTVTYESPTEKDERELRMAEIKANAKAKENGKAKGKAEGKETAANADAE